ncbi:MAG: UDP-N-acetylmuramate dehydrogenase [Halofilum sp. (in: g-proteobacteria)]|nr:UDP-N-acetylmuramate dehydrogenase [Halofilum sp. (in: g-proteobacteria)]
MNAAEHKPDLRGEWRENEPLARYTSWHIGGPADRLYRPADVDDLAAALASLPSDEPVFWLGLGSNLLIREGGIRGTVILTRQLLQGMEYLGRGRVRAEAGVPCAQLAKFCAKHDRAGAEFLAGIPGTVGGALAMNAGAWGGETWPHVEAVETVDRGGVQRERPPEDYEVGYRHVEGPAGEWFTAARFVFDDGDGELARRRVRELLAERGRSQPTGVRSCGSVFTNPAGDHAARLIDAAGLKGTRIGGASVSEKHANFIINHGDATAADVEALIEQVRTEVERTSGVRLQPEVRIVGEPA